MSTIRLLFTCLTLFFALEPACGIAHESRPAYLEINETAPGRYSLLWRTPVLSGMQLPVALKLPDSAELVNESVTQRLSDSLLERRIIDAGDNGLAGKRIEFVGLQGTITDVLVRVKHLDGSPVTVLVHPSQPWVEVPMTQTWMGVLATYIGHGFDHIVTGYDHLLFVFALMLLVRNVRVLVWTITAFTVAHSITLALATLGLVNAPGPPVEAAIALSILLLAHEIGRLWRWEKNTIRMALRPDVLQNASLPLSARWPWIIAFVFGLLHGFGFAGALTAIGLPTADLPLALFAFNLGVELGQLSFIAVVLLLLAQVRVFSLPHWLRRTAPLAATYLVGVAAAYLFLQRLASVIGYA